MSKDQITTQAATDAFNNTFHKCRAEVSMDWWQKIWRMACAWQRGVAAPHPESTGPIKSKNAALLNRLFEMTKAPYYATACDTLTQAEMVIVGLERENYALRAEVARLLVSAYDGQRGDGMGNLTTPNE